MTEGETPKEVTGAWEGVSMPCKELDSVKGKAQLQSPASPVSSTLCVHTNVGWLLTTQMFQLRAEDLHSPPAVKSVLLPSGDRKQRPPYANANCSPITEYGEERTQKRWSSFTFYFSLLLV